MSTNPSSKKSLSDYPVSETGHYLIDFGDGDLRAALAEFSVACEEQSNMDDKANSHIQQGLETTTKYLEKELHRQGSSGKSNRLAIGLLMSGRSAEQSVEVIEVRFRKLDFGDAGVTIGRSNEQSPQSTPKSNQDASSLGKRSFDEFASSAQARESEEDDTKMQVDDASDVSESQDEGPSPKMLRTSEGRSMVKQEGRNADGCKTHNMYPRPSRSSPSSRWILESAEKINVYPPLGTPGTPQGAKFGFIDAHLVRSDMEESVQPVETFYLNEGLWQKTENPNDVWKDLLTQAASGDDGRKSAMETIGHQEFWNKHV